MKENATVKSYLLNLTVITIAQVLTLVTFSGFMIFLSTDGQQIGRNDLRSILQTVVPVIVIACLTSSYFIFKTLTEKIKNSLSLKEKLLKYQQAFIIRSAFFELAGLSGGVGAFVTGDLYFLAAIVLVIALFLLLRASPSSIGVDLNLSANEKAQLENPDTLL